MKTDRRSVYVPPTLNCSSLAQFSGYIQRVSMLFENAITGESNQSLWLKRRSYLIFHHHIIFIWRLEIWKRVQKERASVPKVFAIHRIKWHIQIFRKFFAKTKICKIQKVLEVWTWLLVGAF